MRKNTLYLLIAITFLLFSNSLLAQVSNGLPPIPDSQVLIINHYNADLHFIKAQNPAMVVSPKGIFFTIPVNNEKSVSLKTIPNVDETYLSAASFKLFHSAKAYFGFQLSKTNNLVIHGYIDQKLAYSWTSGQPTRLIFCTPKYYQDHDGCL